MAVPCRSGPACLKGPWLSRAASSPLVGGTTPTKGARHAQPRDLEPFPPRTLLRRCSRRGLRVLGMEACLARLRAVPVGRVAFPDSGTVVVLPVNHLVDGDSVVFRTTWGSKLHRAGDGGTMSYEIDEHDVSTRTGWSVLVIGRAEILRGDEADRLEVIAPPSWTPYSDVSWVRIRAEEVSGREIVPAPTAARGPDGSS